MLDLKQELADALVQGMHEAGFPVQTSAIPVTRSTEPTRGDYSTSVAMMLAQKLKKKPMDLIEAIVAAMPKKSYVGKIEAAEPGFINIWLSEKWLADRLDDVLQHDLCEDINDGKGKRVNIEFISANPTGPMTMGNARTAFVADSFGKVLSCAGYDVTREYYVNDAGKQVKLLGESVLRRMVQAQGEDVEFPEDLYQGEYVKDIAAHIAEDFREHEGRLFSRSDLESEETLRDITTRALAISQAENERITREDLKIEFDVWTSERHLREGGAVDSILKTFKKKKLVYEKDGAVWFAASKFENIEDQVIHKKDGEYTYVLPDIAYNEDKFNRGFDLIFTYLGADHKGHVPKIRAAMKALEHDPDKWVFPISQMFRIVRKGTPVRLSKRAGAVATPGDLINEIGYDAARFIFLRHTLNSHMDLDVDLAKEQSERNPVYYVQYAYVRLQSVLRKAKERGMINSLDDPVLAQEPKFSHSREFLLLKTIYSWPETIVSIANMHEVQMLPHYAHELARAIHGFYKEIPVLTEPDPHIRESKLELVFAARKALGATLDLLGISKPDVM